MSDRDAHKPGDPGADLLRPRARPDSDAETDIIPLSSSDRAELEQALRERIAADERRLQGQPARTADGDEITAPATRPPTDAPRSRASTEPTELPPPPADNARLGGTGDPDDTLRGGDLAPSPPEETQPSALPTAAEFDRPSTERPSGPITATEPALSGSPAATLPARPSAMPSPPQLPAATLPGRPSAMPSPPRSPAATLPGRPNAMPDLAPPLPAISAGPPELAATVADAAPPSPPASPPRPRGRTPRPPSALLPGSLVGHYVVHSHIGAEAGSALYRARAPKSERDLALMVWRISDQLPAATTEAGQKLVAAARTVSAIEHPNVVRVFEAGTRGNDVFVARAYRAEPTLSAWLHQGPRSNRHLVNAFSDTARGLAALHQRDLLHGDLCPRSMVVSGPGRACIRDFGLGRVVATASRDAPRWTRAFAVPNAPAPASAPAADEPQPHPEDDLTVVDMGDGQFQFDDSMDEPATEIDLDRSGLEHLWEQSDDASSDDDDDTAIAADNPAMPYMSPEQHRGDPIDARSDQFALCAVFYEALYATRPFAGDDPRTVAANAAAGRLTAPTSERRVPEWLDVILRRGLAPDPADRFPSLATLLEALGSHHSPRRWGPGHALAATALSLAVVGGGLYALASRTPSCELADESIRARWTTEIAAAVTASLTRTSSAVADSTAARVDTVLSGYRDDLAAMARDVCEDTHVRDEQPAAITARRQQCVDDRAGRFAALTMALSQLDAPTGTGGAAATTQSDLTVVLANAVPAALALPDVAGCDDDARSAGLAGPNANNVDHSDDDSDSERDHAARVAALYAASADLELGRRTAALTQAQALVEDLDDSAPAPLRAAARLLLARAQRQGSQLAAAEANTKAARDLADRADDAELRAAAWVELVAITARTATRINEALALRAQADTAASAAADAAWYRAELMRQLGIGLTRAGRYQQALQLLETADAQHQSARGSDHHSRIAYLSAHADALAGLGRHRDAQAVRAQAIAAIEAHYGADQQPLAAQLLRLGGDHLALGEPKQALAELRHALAIEGSFYGLRTITAARIERSIGVALHQRGDLGGALAALERALDIQRELGTEDSLGRATTLLNLAALHIDRGDFDAARIAAERALALRVELLGKDAPGTAIAKVWVARIGAETGSIKRAVSTLEDAIEVLSSSPSAAPLDLALAHRQLGVALRLQRRPARALRQLEAALAIEEERRGPEHLALAALHREFGEVSLARHQAAAAEQHFTRAREVYLTGAGLTGAGLAGDGDTDGDTDDDATGSPALAALLTGLGESLIQQSRGDAALEPLERALAIHREHPSDPLPAARTQLALARALGHAEEHRERALSLAHEAEQTLASLGKRGAPLLAEVHAWLAASAAAPE